jgi:hypothetical protein
MDNRVPIFLLAAGVMLALAARGRKKQALEATPSPPLPPVPSATPGAPSRATAPPNLGGSRGSARSASFAEVLDILNTEAPKYGLDPRVLRAVMQAESGQQPFGPDGKIIIRFEPHVFARATAVKALGLKRLPTDEEANQYGAKVLNPGMTTMWEGRTRVGGQAAEWETLARARAIDEHAAISSTSFGLGQVMGFNYKLAEYPSPTAMFEDFQTSGVAQALGMLRMIKNVPKQLKALKALDFPAFVASYNGAKIGTSKNAGYVTRMQDNLARSA